MVMAECAKGLSPRVRGNQSDALQWPSEPGSIPACAGEPIAFALLKLHIRVYPRVCGGTSPGERSGPSTPGLSPRVRGNPDQRGNLPVVDGSIPACAGEPPCAPWSLSGTRVYPRVCGGTYSGRNHSEQIGGLSPRVRGNLQVLSGGNVLSGSIPACAGEPLRLSSIRE